MNEKRCALCGEPMPLTPALVVAFIQGAYYSQENGNPDTESLDDEARRLLAKGELGVLESKAKP